MLFGDCCSVSSLCVFCLMLFAGCVLLLLCVALLVVVVCCLFSLRFVGCYVLFAVCCLFIDGLLFVVCW